MELFHLWWWEKNREMLIRGNMTIDYEAITRLQWGDSIIQNNACPICKSDVIFTWCAKRTFWTAGSCLQGGKKYKNDRKNDTIIDWKEKTHCEHRSRPVVWVPNITEEVALISRTIRPHFSFTLISLIYKWWGSVAFLGPRGPLVLPSVGSSVPCAPWDPLDALLTP